MHAIDLALKDLTQLVRNRQAAIFLLVMPIAFTVMFGFLFGGFGSPQDPRLPVGFVDQDNSAVSASLSNLLKASDVIRLEPLTSDVEKKVRDGQLAAAVIVPAGYGGRILKGDIVSLTVIADTTTTGGQTAQNEVQVGASRLLSAAKAAQLSEQAYQAKVGFADESARQKFTQEALSQAIEAWKNPPLTVTMAQSIAIPKDEKKIAPSNAFTHSSPSMMVQFAMAGLIGAAEVLVLERKSKALRRLLTTAISRVEIIVGHYVAMFVMIFLQLTLLVGFGQLVLRVDYFREPLALILVMITMTLWTASLGLLIGVLAQTEDQVIIFSLIPMFILAGLGGAWMPLEYTGPAFQAIGHLLPTAWAIDGFENIVIRGLGINSVLLPAGLMLGYAIVIFGAAVWGFKFE